MTQKTPGGLAQLARALALQAKGHRFDSDILHKSSLHIDNGSGPVVHNQIINDILTLRPGGEGG